MIDVMMNPNCTTLALRWQQPAHADRSGARTFEQGVSGRECHREAEAHRAGDYY